MDYIAYLKEQARKHATTYLDGDFSLSKGRYCPKEGVLTVVATSNGKRRKIWAGSGCVAMSDPY